MVRKCRREIVGHSLTAGRQIRGCLLSLIPTGHFAFGFPERKPADKKIWTICITVPWSKSGTAPNAFKPDILEMSQ
jgi:hypothetical protein